LWPDRPREHNNNYKKNTAFRLSIEQVDIHALFQNDVNQLIVDTRKGRKREEGKYHTTAKQYSCASFGAKVKFIELLFAFIKREREKKA